MRRFSISYSLTIVAFITLFSTINCSKKDVGGGVNTTPVAKSSEAKLLTFEIKAALNTGLLQDVSGVVNESAKTVSLIVPPLATITNLVASYTVSSKAAATVSGAAQQSGVTANNYTNALNFTIIAEDGTFTLVRVSRTFKTHFSNL